MSEPNHSVKLLAEQVAQILANAIGENVACEINFTFHLSQGGIRRAESTRRQAMIPDGRR